MADDMQNTRHNAMPCVRCSQSSARRRRVRSLSMATRLRREHRKHVGIVGGIVLCESIPDDVFSIGVPQE